NISNITLSCFLSANIFYLVKAATQQLLSSQTGERMLLLAPALVAMAATHYFFHIALLSLMIQFRHGKKIKETVADTLPWEPITSIVGATAAGALCCAFQNFTIATGFITLLLLAPVPILIYYAFKTYGDNLTAKQTHYQELSNLYDSIL